MKNTWNYFTLLVFGVYILYLFSIGRLGYFIHPRYEILTLCAGVVLVGVAIVGLYQKIKLKEFKIGFKNFEFGVFVLVAVLVFVPVKSLSSESFSIRSGGTNSKISANEAQNIKKKFSFGADSSSFTMYDWVMAKNLNDNSVFTAKKFAGSGFISPTKDTGYFNISRFVVSCCVVDATPAGLLVKYNWQDSYHRDDWVEVKGTFTIETVEGKAQPVIVPSSVNRIDQPKNIYLNRN